MADSGFISTHRKDLPSLRQRHSVHPPESNSKYSEPNNSSRLYFDSILAFVHTLLTVDIGMVVEMLVSQKRGLVLLKMSLSTMEEFGSAHCHALEFFYLWEEI